MARIKWIEDGEARGELAELYEEIRRGHATGQVPAIMRTMSVRPDFLAAIRQAVNTLHFRDGALTRAQHEMIASHVAALNHCRY
jgi:hypothetical protein